MNQDQSPHTNSTPKAKLRQQDTFVYQPKEDDGEVFGLANQTEAKMPELPSVKSLNQFITIAKEVVKLPEKKTNLAAHESGTLSLDDMLEEAHIIDIKRFPELVSLGLELMQSIDSRCFATPPRAITPFQALTQQADLAKELATSVKRGIQDIQKYFVLDFEEVLRRVMLAIDHHRGDSVNRLVEPIEIGARLVSWEICFDGGVSPVIPKQDIKIFDDVDKHSRPIGEGASSSTGQKDKVKPRKQINYGREAAGKSPSNDGDIEADIMARRSEETNSDLHNKLEMESRADARSFLHQNDRDETKNFLERIRKGKIRHEMFGALKITAETAQRREDSDALKKLEAKLPAWMNHAMLVSSASIDRNEARPFFQSVADQLVQLALRVIQFVEVSTKKEFTSSAIKAWGIKQLEENLKSSVRLHRAYDHVVKVMEAVAPRVKEAGLNEVLDERRSSVINILCPHLKTLTPEENPIFNSYMSSRREAALEMKIELLARSLVVQNIDDKLRQFADDSPDKMSYARELAKKRLGIEN
jgi:hypothetical protein